MKIIIASDKLTGKFSLKFSEESHLEENLNLCMSEISRDFKISQGFFHPFYAVYDSSHELGRVFLDYALECSMRNIAVPDFGDDVWSVVTHGLDTTADFYEEKEEES